MQLKPEQLNQHLKNGFKPVYMVTGDEPLQKMEALDALRSTARSQGYLSRELLEVNKDFQWDRLMSAADSMSLFADKRVLELRMSDSGPGAEGSKSLQHYAERPAEDTVLLIDAGKVDKRSQTAKWYQSLDKVGVIIKVWPVKAQALPGWLQQRARSKGIEIERDAVAMLSARVEGNLLAAAQEIEKLALLYGSAENAGDRVRLSLREVADAVANSARYSIYDLVDAALAGHTGRATRVLSGLREEGTAAPLVLWALAGEIRSLAQYKRRLESGENQSKVLAQVWASRKGLIMSALQRLSARTCSILLEGCAHTDQVIKGLQSGREWDELLAISSGLADPGLLRKRFNISG